MTPAPEVSRPFRVDRVTASGVDFVVTADAAELGAMAARLGVPSVASFTCRFRLTSGGATGVILAEGALDAVVERECVASLELFEQIVTEGFRVRFVPSERVRDEDDLEDDDELPYDGATVDLGEAGVEQLALTLDPYPRKPDAALAFAEDADAGGAFGMLRRLAARDGDC